jgi:hypothetical protein
MQGKRLATNDRAVSGATARDEAEERLMDAHTTVATALTHELGVGRKTSRRLSSLAPAARSASAPGRSSHRVTRSDPG